MGTRSPADRLPGDQRLEQALGRCLGPFLGPEVRRIGVALSGGLDSTVMTHALVNWLSVHYPSVALWAVHVNHNVRNPQEQGIEEQVLLANCLSWRVPLTALTLGKDAIRQLCRETGAGFEEGARILRYRFFDGEVRRLALSLLCLAHQEDDGLELQVMRIFQGQGSGVAMPEYRLPYLRPFLSIPRSCLLDHARRHGLAWHEDSTNGGDAYLRNRIRHGLLPAVEVVFPGYRTALAALRGAAARDEAFLERQAGGLAWGRDAKYPGLQADWQDFVALDPALRWRAVRQACLQLLRAGEIARMPGRDLYQAEPVAKGIRERAWLVSLNGVQIGRRAGQVFVRPHIVVARKKGYLHYLTEPGNQEIPGLGKVGVSEAPPGTPGLRLPVVIRSLRHGDVSPDDGRCLWQFLRKRGIPVEDLAGIPVLVSKGRLVRVLCAPWTGRDLNFSLADGQECDGSGSGLHRVEILDLELPT